MCVYVLYDLTHTHTRGHTLTHTRTHTHTHARTHTLTHTHTRTHTHTHTLTHTHTHTVTPAPSTALSAREDTTRTPRAAPDATSVETELSQTKTTHLSASPVLPGLTAGLCVSV